MHYETPWPHIILDNFLQNEKLRSLQNIIVQHAHSFRQDRDDEMKINYKFLPDIELAKYFLSSEFKTFMQKCTGQSLQLNSKSLVQLRMMDSGSPAMPVHVDNQDEKSVVCILYVSPEWQPHYGGELRLLADKNAPPESAKIIEPLENRMILFSSEDSHWHSVSAVKDWVRYSIIMEWIICPPAEAQ